MRQARDGKPAVRQCHQRKSARAEDNPAFHGIRMVPQLYVQDTRKHEQAHDIWLAFVSMLSGPKAGGCVCIGYFTEEQKPL